MSSRSSRPPRSLLALLICVAIEFTAWVVWWLTSSGARPAGCDEDCFTDREIAFFAGLVVGLPLLAGQLTLGGIAIALLGRRQKWGVVSGLLAFLVASAISASLVYLWLHGWSL